MSEIGDTARVSILLADFANTDAAGKLNIIGGGVAVTGISPESGQTAPLTVVLQVHVQPRFVNQSFALELALYGDDGQVVVPPGPVEMPPIRIAQPVHVEMPRPAPGSYLPPDSVWPGSNMLVNFNNGLPLAAGKTYEWRAAIDGGLVCTANLHVAGPAPVTIG